MFDVIVHYCSHLSRFNFITNNCGIHFQNFELERQFTNRVENFHYDTDESKHSGNLDTRESQSLI